MRTRLGCGLVLILAVAGCRHRCGDTSSYNDRCSSSHAAVPAARAVADPGRQANAGVPLGYPTTYAPVSYAPPMVSTPIFTGPIPPMMSADPGNVLPPPAGIPSPGVPTGPANELPPPAGFGR